MILPVAAVYAVFIAMETIPLIRGKRTRVAVPCLILFALGLAVQCLHELKIDVPSPAPLLSDAISGLFSLE